MATPEFRAADGSARDALPVLVSDTQPTAIQRKVAWGILLFLSAVFALATPFYSIELAVVPAFVPAVHAIVCITGLIAAAFLFSQYAVQRQPAFLVLASGYLLAGLFAFFQSLAFPNAYSATGLIGATPSTAAWLFLAWRTSFSLAVMAYALTRRPAKAGVSDRPAGVPIAAAIAGTVAAACVVTWLLIVAESHLPVLFTDAHRESWIAPYTTVPAITFSLVAILLLAIGRRTTLDLWLVVTLITALPDIVVPVSRYALGFYLARGCELISSCTVLIALLTESSILYARLASARTLQAHGEVERLNSLEMATAAIAHELRQPLSAIRLHTQTCALLLRAPVPALAEAGAILGDIDRDATRAGEVIDRIRDGLRRQELCMEALDINMLVSDAVRLIADDAAARQVTIATELADEPPHAAVDRTQITQVLLNLMANGMDAMDGAPAVERRLSLAVAEHNAMVVVSVKDNGSGISPESMPRLFEPFFTTRRDGMGLGLAIAQSIIVAHKGILWAQNNEDRGAAFCFSLPVCGPGSAPPAPEPR